MDKINSFIKTTIGIHVATANSTGSYMTVLGLLVAACGCVVVYCTWVNSLVCAAVQYCYSYCYACMGALMYGLGAYEPTCIPHSPCVYIQHLIMHAWQG